MNQKVTAFRRISPQHRRNDAVFTNTLDPGYTGREPALAVTDFLMCSKVLSSRVSGLFVVWRCLFEPIRFSRKPTCDRQTDRHTTTAYAALAWRRAVKTIA